MKIRKNAAFCGLSLMALCAWGLVSYASEDSRTADFEADQPQFFDYFVQDFEIGSSIPGVAGFTLGRVTISANTKITRSNPEVVLRIKFKCAYAVSEEVKEPCVGLLPGGLTAWIITGEVTWKDTGKDTVLRNLVLSGESVLELHGTYAKSPNITADSPIIQVYFDNRGNPGGKTVFSIPLEQD
jgi:hypothetical protein